MVFIFLLNNNEMGKGAWERHLAPSWRAGGGTATGVPSTCLLDCFLTVYNQQMLCCLICRLVIDQSTKNKRGVVYDLISWKEFKCSSLFRAVVVMD